MMIEKNKNLKNFLAFLVVANTVIFLVMAYFHLLSTDPKSAVFIDFWERFAVYSLWFIGFALYLKYISPNKPFRNIVLLIISLNIPFFCSWRILTRLATHPI